MVLVMDSVVEVEVVEAIVNRVVCERRNIRSRYEGLQPQRRPRKSKKELTYKVCLESERVMERKEREK